MHWGPTTRVANDPESARAAKRRVSRHGAVALAGMLAPAVMFPILLAAAAFTLPQFEWAWRVSAWPIELWLLIVSGTVATVGGIADWRFHRSGDTAVGKPEHRAHVLALIAGGLPMFVLMCAASVIARPALLLVPVLLVLLLTTALICYDEFVYHRKRCDRFETLTHRLLVFGNGAAWLAWTHWCFVRPAL